MSVRIGRCTFVLKCLVCGKVLIESEDPKEALKYLEKLMLDNKSHHTGSPFEDLYKTPAVFAVIPEEGK